MVMGGSKRDNPSPLFRFVKYFDRFEDSIRQKTLILTCFVLWPEILGVSVHAV